jgi:hypothetical protein
VVRGDTPIFVYRRRRGVGSVDLGAQPAKEVSQSAFFRRVALTTGAGPANLYMGLDGPGTESLRAEFQPA